MGFQVPASTHVAGDPNFTPDADNAWAALEVLGAGNALNLAYGTADPTGTLDSTAVLQNALGNGDVILPPGTFLLNSSALAPTLTGSRIRGSGTGLTKLVVGSGFTGASAIVLPTAGYCKVHDLSIVGANTGNTALGGSQAWNAISGGTGRFNRVEDVFFQYVNGWCVEDIGTSGAVGYATMLRGLSGLNCAGGVHVKGVSGSSWGAQIFLSDLNFQQIGTGSGASANLDVFRFEDAFDITGTNFNTAVSDASTGSSVHIMGHCSAIYLAVMDLGSFPNVYTETNPTVLIEDFGGNSPTNITITNGIVQAGLYGIRITGGAQHMRFSGLAINNNWGHGISVEGTGTDINFDGCRLAANGAANGVVPSTGTYYDINWSSTTATGSLVNMTLSSTVSATGAVTNPANFAPGNNAVTQNWLCNGSGATSSNVFPSGSASPMITRGIIPWNPRGSVTVTVPASGVAAAIGGSDRMYYVTANPSNPCTITVSGQTTFSLSVAAGAVNVPVLVPATATIKWTGTAPTWLTYGT